MKGLENILARGSRIQIAETMNKIQTVKQVSISGF
jgi:hypothetical protein